VSVTKNVAQYVRDKGISVVKMTSETGLPYQPIQRSLSANSDRDLRADELIAICHFINKNPNDFADR